MITGAFAAAPWLLHLLQDWARPRASARRTWRWIWHTSRGCPSASSSKPPRGGRCFPALACPTRPYPPTPNPQPLWRSIAASAGWLSVEYAHFPRIVHSLPTHCPRIARALSTCSPHHETGGPCQIAAYFIRFFYPFGIISHTSTCICTLHPLCVRSLPLCRSGITSQLDEVIFNGDIEGGYPGCINLSFAYVEGESLLMALKDIALSSGRCVYVCMRLRVSLRM